MDDVMDVLVASGAVRKGHFLLTSGLHSDTYVEKFRLLERPDLAGPLLARLATHFADAGVEVVLSPAVGGVIVGYEVARALGVRAVFAEREAGRLTMRRGFQLGRGERCLIVEDIVTTGGSVRELLDVAEAQEADIVGVGLVVDRSGGQWPWPYATKALASLDAPSWDADDCPGCRAGLPLERRGSRELGKTSKGSAVN